MKSLGNFLRGDCVVQCFDFAMLVVWSLQVDEQKHSKNIASHFDEPWHRLITVSHRFPLRHHSVYRFFSFIFTSKLATGCWRCSHIDGGGCGHVGGGVNVAFRRLEKYPSAASIPKISAIIAATIPNIMKATIIYHCVFIIQTNKKTGQTIRRQPGQHATTKCAMSPPLWYYFMQLWETSNFAISWPGANYSGLNYFMQLRNFRTLEDAMGGGTHGRMRQRCVWERPRNGR